MLTHKTKCFNLIVKSLLLLGIMTIYGIDASATGGVELYTPYTKISVPPGESIDYSIDVINNGNGIKNVGISIAGLPKDWNRNMKSGGWNIEQVSVLPGEKKTFKLHVDVPLKIDKGSYHFNVVAKGYYSLPLTVNVSKQGTFKTEFTTEQPNMEGDSKSTFTFKADLKNSTGDKQLYALTSAAPRGWNVSFKVNNKKVTSVDVAPNATESTTIEIHAPAIIAAGKYNIPIRARTSSTSAELNLEVVITGTYEMELTTPTGLLSTDITAGSNRRVELEVRNTGSSELSGINLSYKAPVKWEVTFNPKTVDVLAPGKSTKVFANIKADKNAIAGDYVTNLEAKTPEVTSKAAFRVSVKTSMIWGWAGILIILIALGSVYNLFRKFGRR